MNLNSPFAQFLLKWAMSKAGPFIAAGASWLAIHIIVWTHAVNILPADAANKIQGGLESGATEFAMSLMALVYAWVVNRQSQGVMILKKQLDASPQPTPPLDLK